MGSHWAALTVSGFAAASVVGMLLVACAPTAPTPTVPPPRTGESAAAPRAASPVVKPVASPPGKPAASPQARPDWQAEWDKKLAGARQEGKLVIASTPAGNVRKELGPTFEAKFGIPIDHLVTSGSEAVQRLKSERLAGLYTTDVVLTGIPTLATNFYPDKMLDPLKPQLFLPEVVDTSKWKPRKLPFVDPEEQYILRVFSTVDGIFSINTQLLKPEEFGSINNLLDLRWKGKITAHDPTVPGAGAGTAAALYAQFGEDFLQRLYIGQEVVISRDQRQLTDWLARGVYPLSLFVGPQVAEAQDQGLPVMEIYRLPDAMPVVDGASGNVVVIDKAPHPNAAQVFVNWLASKEGLEIFARNSFAGTLRNDIDESWLRPEEVPREGQAYFDNSEWNWVIGGKEQVRLRLADLLAR